MGSELKNGNPAKMLMSIPLPRWGFVRRSQTRYTRNVPVGAPATNRGIGKWYSPAYTIGQRFGADVPPWVDLEKECYMPIQFSCSNCGAAFNASESMAGSQARCNGCGAIVVVPGLIPVASEASQWSETPADFGPNQRSTKPGLPKIEEAPAFVWFLLAGGAFVLFLPHRRHLTGHGRRLPCWRGASCPTTRRRIHFAERRDRAIDSDNKQANSTTLSQFAHTSVGRGRLLLDRIIGGRSGFFGAATGSNRR